MEQFEKIAKYADIILEFCPNFDDFDFADIIQKSSLSDTDKTEARALEKDIRSFLTEKNYAIYQNSMTFRSSKDPILYKLRNEGREVKKVGGHFKNIEAKEAEENERNRIAKEKEEFELLTKKWFYKTRFIPLVLSVFAIIISIFVYFQKDKEIRNKVQSKNEIKTLSDSTSQNNLQINRDTTK